ncbi:Formate/nitrite transporter-domain-containing protein [Fusarium solani]|uniref:Formate/nitrite transporter-domain-containing protein n=1 Tax=Fusarium solani TaxID=169388 RepID=A0A9P9KF45_FUSSL|nr:Formate/nitrite transporter-domain-containing protein [Fusarium solani]KAH7254981.1 Formate/nitrite transporter-domain-containing protein [Fusarium solani]
MSSPLVVNVNNLAAYTPAETIELISRIGVRKGNMRPDKVFLSAVSAGCLLSFGCAVSLTAMTAPWYQENAPGLIKLIGAGVFPLGLVMVVLTGADLFTATTMVFFQFTMTSVLHSRLPVRKMLLHWFLCFFGNLAGSLFVMAIIMGYGGVFDASPYKEQVISFATKKQITPQLHQIFLRGIGCNWLVCLAVFLGTQAKDLSSKVIGMWWPIFAFVSLGLDHVVANMFYMPLGIWLHTPGLNVGLYIWKGIIPATLGNVLGGGLFVAAYYWHMYLCMEAPVKIDGVEYQGPHVEMHSHLHFLDGRRKSAATDEESRIETRHVSVSHSTK